MTTSSARDERFIGADVAALNEQIAEKSRHLWSVSRASDVHRQLQAEVDDLVQRKLELERNAPTLRQEHQANMGGRGLAFLATSAASVAGMVWLGLPLAVFIPIALVTALLGLFWISR
jgi:cell division protein FtsB